MKKFVISVFLLASCVSSKTEKEFNEKRASVVLVVNEAKHVEKKTTLNILIPEYINHAPPDTTLLTIFNSYLLYYLDTLGYKKLIIKNASFNGDLFKNEKLIYSVDVKDLPFKEYKHKEEVGNVGETKTIKMRGIEVNPEADLAIGITNLSADKDAIKAMANAYRDETQEGQFKKTYGVKDIVQDNKNGSIKYVYNVRQLEDGVFQNLCVDAAWKLATEIDYAVKRLYQRQKKQKNN